MKQQLFFAITILGTGVLLNSPSTANQRQCQERGINCMAKCDDPTGGAGDWEAIRTNVCNTAAGSWIDV